MDQEDRTAMVNAANAELMPGGGVAGAIHRAAGSGFEGECRSLSPIRPGETVIIGAHDLPNRYVIHALGLVYGADEPAEKLLADCYRNSLHLAEERGIDSVDFPAISTGAFGYALEEAAEVALETVVETAKELRAVEKIRFVLYGKKELDAHKKELDAHNRVLSQYTRITDET